MWQMMHPKFQRRGMFFINRYRELREGSSCINVDIFQGCLIETRWESERILCFTSYGKDSYKHEVQHCCLRKITQWELDNWNLSASWAVILIVIVVFDSDVESESDFQNGSTNKKSAAADGSDLEDDFDFYGWIKPCKDITNRTDNIKVMLLVAIFIGPMR